jgi:hypothetical protein
VGGTHPKKKKKIIENIRLTYSGILCYTSKSNNNERYNMAQAMTKYQLDHFRDKVKRELDPMIEQQELLVRQYVSQATDTASKKLAKKIGAQSIIDKLKEAEQYLLEAQATAKTFFKKKANNETLKGKLDYKFASNDIKEDRINVALCEEQIREWASELAQQEIEKRPEGKKLSELKQVKRVALDTIMEAHAPAELIANLDKVLQASVGIGWNNTAPKISA